MSSRSRIVTLIGVSTLVFGGTVGLSACNRSTNLNVVNRSTVELTNVVATGSGFTQSIASIPAGQQRSISVSPRSESGLKLDFDAKGKRFTSLPQGYFEGGSKAQVTAIVAPDFTVTVDVKN
jgi:hypothetical protein